MYGSFHSLCLQEIELCYQFHFCFTKSESICFKKRSFKKDWNVSNDTFFRKMSFLSMRSHLYSRATEHFTCQNVNLVTNDCFVVVSTPTSWFPYHQVKCSVFFFLINETWWLEHELKINIFRVSCILVGKSGKLFHNSKDCT